MDAAAALEVLRRAAPVHLPGALGDELTSRLEAWGRRALLPIEHGSEHGSEHAAVRETHLFDPAASTWTDPELQRDLAGVMRSRFGELSAPWAERFAPSRGALHISFTRLAVMAPDDRPGNRNVMYLHQDDPRVDDEGRPLTVGRRGPTGRAKYRARLRILAYAGEWGTAEVTHGPGGALLTKGRIVEPRAGSLVAFPFELEHAVLPIPSGLRFNVQVEAWRYTQQLLPAAGMMAYGGGRPTAGVMRAAEASGPVKAIGIVHDALSPAELSQTQSSRVPDRLRVTHTAAVVARAVEGLWPELSAPFPKAPRRFEPAITSNVIYPPTEAGRSHALAYHRHLESFSGRPELMAVWLGGSFEGGAFLMADDADGSGEIRTPVRENDLILFDGRGWHGVERVTAGARLAIIFYIPLAVD